MDFAQNKKMTYSSVLHSPKGLMKYRNALVECINNLT